MQHPHVDRLDEVTGKAGRLALRDIRVHAETAEGNSAHVILGEERAHDFQAGAIGQADVADDEVDPTGAKKLVGLLQGGGHRSGDGNVVAHLAQQPPENLGRVDVIFHQQEPQLARALAEGLRAGRFAGGRISRVGGRVHDDVECEENRAESCDPVIRDARSGKIASEGTRRADFAGIAR